MQTGGKVVIKKTRSVASLFVALIILFSELPVRAPAEERNYNLVDKPYEMLVLGDSVVWGQGLLEGEKFTRLVRRDLESILKPRKVNITDMSHSGATLLKPGALPDLAFDKAEYEAPIPTPSVSD